MAVSSEAEAVCKMHYPKQCGACPIRPECMASHEWSHAGLNQHNESMRVAAVKWLNS